MNKRSLLIDGVETSTDEDLKVDRYGAKSAQIKVLKKELEDLSKEIIKGEKLEVGDTLVGKKYSVKVTERVRNTLDPKRVLKMMGGDINKVLDIASISNTKAVTVLSEEDMDKCVSSAKVSNYLKIGEVKK